MGRTARIGWLWFCGLIGVGGLIWALAVLPGALESSRAGGDLFAFLLLLIWFPALIVVVLLLVVITAMFRYIAQHDSPSRALRRARVSPDSGEPGDPGLDFETPQRGERV
jgi:hypothetical protein